MLTLDMTLMKHLQAPQVLQSLDAPGLIAGGLVLLLLTPALVPPQEVA